MSTQTQTTVAKNLLGANTGKIRQMFLETLTEDDVKVMTRQLIDLGKEGDFRAIKFIFTYLLGKPGTASEIDDLNRSAARSLKKHRDVGMPPLTAADLMAAGRTSGASDIRVANLVGNKPHDKARK